jgi:hypothetical protein
LIFQFHERQRRGVGHSQIAKSMKFRHVTRGLGKLPTLIEDTVAPLKNPDGAG